MTKILLTTVTILSVLGIYFSSPQIRAQAASVPPAETYAGLPLCQPDAYVADPEDCLPLGPSAFLSDLAKQGVTYPAPPLPAVKPDPGLNAVTAKYAKINLAAFENAPVYSSLEDAIAGNNPIRSMLGGKGLRYISYIQRIDNEGGHYLQLPGGEWMRASPAGVSSDFQGLVFRGNPTNPFGWIIERVKPKVSPSTLSADVADELPQNSVVPIYKIVKAEETDWYMIGPNQWVPRHYIRQFPFNPTPPKGVENNRWIEINLFEQTIGVYEKGQLLFASLIATGVEPYYTRPGLFKIYKKKPFENMSGAFNADKSDFYYLADVPWTMYFDEARALHGAYWRAWFGIEQSHGCVNLSLGDSHWLYDWAKENDWVYVWDPSGKTPTDPKFYTQGGA
jgi:hypothetical protein